MAKHTRSFRSQGIRNLKSAGYPVAKFTGRTTGKAADGLLKWAATNHSDMSRVIDNG